jgi:hypothetical protein
LSRRDDIVELPIAAQFEDRVEIILICEVAICADDIGVIEEALYLQFPYELDE